ncbi:MAG: pyridoxamine kinase [Candidatus Syntrophosphaera sp.]
MLVVKDAEMKDEKCKRILAIHDLSGFGHTSLMAEISIMYRLGIRVCALPTAVLSANTEYSGSYWVDMSDHLEGLVGHWKSLGLGFDGIHTGFLSSARQADQIGNIIDTLKNEGTIVIVDPVMGDVGKLYSCFNSEIIDAMRHLIEKADLITPNYFEAAWLAGAEPTGKADHEAMLSWCRSISRSKPLKIVVTSAPSRDPDILETLYYDPGEDSLERYPFKQKCGKFPGAGDCFAAFLLAGLVNGFSLQRSVKASVKIMARAIALEYPKGGDWREGIVLEQVLQWDLHSYYKD